MSINPDHLYSLKTTELKLISNESCINDDKLINWFWAPDKNLVNKLESDLNKKNISTNIIDVGCGFGSAIFSKSTHILGKDLKYNANNLNFIDFDLDFFFTIGEENGVYINGEMLKADDDFLEMINKLKVFYEKFKSKWAKVLASRKQTSNTEE